MKTPKIGDIVIIIKPGLFNGFSGEVLSNNPDIKNSLSVMVNLTNSQILWNFAYADILQAKDKGIEELKLIDTAIQSIDSNESLTKPKKRSYQKRDKGEVKVTKEKRKYTKRQQNG